MCYDEALKVLPEISMKLTADLLERFAKVLEKYNLAEIHYGAKACELYIVRKIEPSVSLKTTCLNTEQQIALNTEAQESPSIDQSLEHIKSPIVGTVYLSPKPDAPTFIKVGERIIKDQPILIIEAMKVMNQVRSPLSGTIKQILVTNTDPVEFGDVLVVIQKDE